MSDAITIYKRFEALEKMYKPCFSNDDFNFCVISLRDAIKQLNYPEDTGLRLVKVGLGRKHELKVMPK